jgi:hypothetical protein
MICFNIYGRSHLYFQAVLLKKKHFEEIISLCYKDGQSCYFGLGNSPLRCDPRVALKCYSLPPFIIWGFGFGGPILNL